MTANCANPACKAPFRYFRSGTIYLLDQRDRATTRLRTLNTRDRIEYFWLCGECSRTLRLVLDQQGSAALEAVSRTTTQAALCLTQAARPEASNEYLDEYLDEYLALQRPPLRVAATIG